MAYTPENNPYVPGDPYMYDLKWIVNKLNNYGIRIESAEKSIKDLQDLDLQPEVDAKLDEMAADGTLTTLFNKYVINTYDTAADLISDHLERGIAFTKGYTAPGDGYGCAYVILTNTPDMPFITLNSGLVAVPLCDTFKIGYVKDGNFETNLQRAALKFSKVEISGNWEIDNNILIENTDINIDFTGAAIDIRTPQGITFNSCNVKLTGGTFDYSNGVTPIAFQGNSDKCAFKFYLCGSVNISDLTMTNIYNGSGAVFEDCNNISINGCEMLNGTHAGFYALNSFDSFVCKNSNFEQFRNTVDNYSYGACTGFIRLQQGDTMPGYVEYNNCIFKSCYWEGCDTHGSKITKITGCRFYNCYRVAGVYRETNIGFIDRGGNLIISNCHVVNDPAFAANQLFAMGGQSSLPYDTINIDNSSFIFKPGALTQVRYTNISMDNVIFDCLGTSTMLFFFANCKASYNNILIKNTARTNGAINHQACIISVRNLSYTSDTSPAVYPYSVMQYDKYSAIDWDYLNITPYSGGAKGVMALGARMVRTGEPLQLNTMIWTSYAKTSATGGYGYEALQTAQTGSLPAHNDSTAVFDVGSDTIYFIPGVIITLSDGVNTYTTYVVDVYTAFDNYVLHNYIRFATDIPAGTYSYTIAAVTTL